MLPGAQASVSACAVQEESQIAIKGQEAAAVAITVALQRPQEAASAHAPTPSQTVANAATQAPLALSQVSICHACSLHPSYLCLLLPPHP